MTREEAIWWVNHLFEIRKEEYFNKGMMKDAKEVEKAQRMAIEALQEPKTIITMEPPYRGDKGIAMLFKGKDDKLILEALKELPSAEAEWIPCSERLPEDEQPILFSTTTGRVHQGRFHRDNSVNRWYSSLDKMRAYNNVVNAWMPLPEPYREDGE